MEIEEKSYIRLIGLYNWQGNPKPFFENMLDDDGISDIEVKLPTFKNVPWKETYKGANPQIFKYQFLYSKINGGDD